MDVASKEAKKVIFGERDGESYLSRVFFGDIFYNMYVLIL